MTTTYNLTDGKAQKRRCPTLDSCLLRLKLFNLFFWGGTAFVRPYCVNFLHALGLTTQESAIIVGAVPVAGIITGPCIGILADRLGAHRRLLVVCLCAWIAGFQGMAAVPPRMPASFIVNETNVTSATIETATSNDFRPDLTFWFALLSYFVIEVMASRTRD